MYFKIPLEADLSETSYRCYKVEEDFAYIEFNEGFVGEDWEEIGEEETRKIAPEWFSSEQTNPEPTQLDRIESALALLTADTVTPESIETAISEGVNEV